MKVGRNDACPCGSGNKYKKCCIDNPFAIFPQATRPVTAKKSRFAEYIKNHNGKDLLNIVTSLQTIPENYGKNVRIEIIAKEIVKNINDGDAVSLAAFKDIVHEEFPRHHMEDPPEELFTENVAFFGGNYIVTQGITTNGADILRALIQGIFLNENELNNEFKETIHDAIQWILELGDIIFKRANLERYAFEEASSNDIKFSKLVVDNSFSSEWLDYFSRRHRISRGVLDDFVLPFGADLTDENADNNPLLKKPFVRHNDELFFVLPSAQMTALNEYIIAKANEFGCETELLFAYNKAIYLQAQERLYKMGWKRLSIPLPENKHSIGLKEGVYLIDYNKLAYVCFTDAALNGTYGSIETVQQQDVEYLHQHIKRLDKRTDEVISFLHNHKPNYEILTLLLGNHIGRPLSIGINLGKPGDERIAFPVFDFIRLADIEKWDMLSIWKFAKVYRIDSEKTRITSTSVVDTYWLYKDNHESFFNLDNHHYGSVHITVGSGAGLIRDSIKEEDFHVVPGYHDGSPVYHFVKRALSMAPIYKAMSSEGIERVLEVFSFPLWVTNNQTGHEKFEEFRLTFVNAIIFWMFKLHEDVKYLNSLNTAPIYIDIVLDEQFYSDNPSPVMTDVEPIFETSIKGRTITFKIPFSLSNTLLLPNNGAERMMMKNLLLAFNGFEGTTTPVELIEAAIDNCMPLGPAKMILYLHTKNDIKLDPRWLLSTRYISDAETSLIFQELPKLLPYPVPEKITDPKEKIKVSNDIVGLLIAKIRKKLSEFDTVNLLRHLIVIHEGYIREREFRRIHLPAQIACYSDVHQKVEEMLKKNKQLVNSTLAVRCLIEFIAAEAPHGGKESNYDEIDQMMAMMNEVVNYGFLSDAIYFGIENPDMGTAASGAIIVKNSFYEEKIKPFNEAKAYTEIESYVDAFPYRFSVEQDEEGQNTPFGERINAAFSTDWGVSLSGILGICIGLSMLAERSESSVAFLSPDKLVEELLNLTTLTEDEIRCGLEKLTLIQRPDFEKAPAGYQNSDIWPWKYNREFSFLRRPLVLLTQADGNQTYFWGLRNSYAASSQIQTLLYSGRIKTYNHPNIDTLLGEINIRNGKRFRNEVMDWFKQQSNFTTVDYEVSIKPGGHIPAEKDYGDIDVFTVNELLKTIYAVECKDTEQAKNIHEMKNELDKYLGKSGRGSLIEKHVERDRFIQRNKKALENLVDDVEDYKIVSIIVTSEDLPLSYIEDMLPLPFVSFPMLKRNGVEGLPNS